VIAAGRLPTEITAPAAAIPFAIAALIIVFGVLVSLRYGFGAASVFTAQLGLGLEFFLAAGLIRLASANTFEMLGLAAAIIFARRVILRGVRYGVQATRYSERQP
jgi:hypothetical protein